MSQTVRAADLLARRLYDAGCRWAFGIPGGEVLTFVDALEKAGIRFVLAKHENAAGFMAEGVYHMTGAPGILVATVGPGVANALNVAANAEQDRVPLIVVSGCVDEDEAVTYNHQVFDHSQVFRPVVKASFRVTAGAVDAQADKAVAIALDPRPGPVHLDLPISVAAAEVPVPALPTRRSSGLAGVPATGAALDTARDWLAGAERPVMVVGLDVLSQGGEAAVRAFAETFGIPTVATYKAKGIVPDDSPLSLGGAGLSPVADRQLLPVLKAADLIVLAGYDPIEMRVGWRNVWDAGNQRVIEVAAAPNTHYMHQSSISFVGDVGASLAVIGEGVEPKATRWPGGEPAKVREALAGAYGQNEAWGPAAIVTTVRQTVPRDAVITIDSGAHRILASQVWESFVPHAVLQSTGLCTMGCALPLATGAKIAAPERAVVAFTGDAGLEMVLGELVTLRDTGLPVIVVVFVDASLALIEMKQRSMTYANAGVDFAETDFAGIARTLGGRGVVCEDRETLAAAIRDGLGADTFTLCACRIDRKSYDGRI
ncbi:acetolactate synthase [Thalassobaculum fulvum]|uniref:Acetolactate synthase n=1 Tax=Thalassobaculum fulvum TaxID=1633335 RepID=A0A919CQU3_9PROT|nr:thiamine pyrophosphate-binding protein [Thalassobaculum fulvum]GHD56812.1 acetolactate synthase [Thalassobaculum fulvum]